MFTILVEFWNDQKNTLYFPNSYIEKKHPSPITIIDKSCSNVNINYYYALNFGKMNSNKKVNLQTHYLPE